MLGTLVVVTDAQVQLYKKKKKKILIGYQIGRKKKSTSAVSFIIHSQQMKLVQWEQSIMDERR